MNTKLLMTISALFLGITGLILSFFPKEIISYLNDETNVITTLILQIIGSVYLGFGMLNWMAKGTRIGGIYNRPIAIGNFMHFGVGAMTLIKVVFGIQIHAEIIIPLTIIYGIFAISFAYVFMTNPGISKKE
jgi:Na+-driven multidrug efflux pump